MAVRAGAEVGATAPKLNPDGLVAGVRLPNKLDWVVVGAGAAAAPKENAD